VTGQRAVLLQRDAGGPHGRAPGIGVVRRVDTRSGHSKNAPRPDPVRDQIAGRSRVTSGKPTCGQAQPAGGAAGAWASGVPSVITSDVAADDTTVTVPEPVSGGVTELSVTVYVAVPSATPAITAE